MPMEEILWKFARRNRDLSELRKDIKGIWHDDAARDINRKYLDPHESDAQEVQSALQKQYVYVAEASKFRHQALTAERRVSDLVDKMTRSLNATDKEMTLVYSSYEESRELHNRAKDILPKVDQLIQSANSSCRGVITRDEYNRTYSG